MVRKRRTDTTFEVGEGSGSGETGPVSCRRRGSKLCGWSLQQEGGEIHQDGRVYIPESQQGLSLNMVHWLAALPCINVSSTDFVEALPVICKLSFSTKMYSNFSLLFLFLILCKFVSFFSRSNGDVGIPCVIEVPCTLLP